METLEKYGINGTCSEASIEDWYECGSLNCKIDDFIEEMLNEAAFEEIDWFNNNTEL